MVFKVIFLVFTYIIGLCAQSNSTNSTVDKVAENFISGGVYARQYAFPYQVSVQCERVHLCGGSILNYNWVLSSAGCVVDYTDRELEILAGTNTLNSGGIRISVIKIVFIGTYRYPSTDDIVVLKLRRSLPNNHPGIGFVALPTYNTPGGTSCIVSGWGAAQQGQYTQSNLKALYTTTITLSICQSFYTNVQITTSNVCTLTRVGEGICDGDRGDPLVDTDSIRRGVPFQVGIASAYVPCGQGYPDIYTRLYPYVGTIRQIILQ